MGKLQKLIKNFKTGARVPLATGDARKLFDYNQVYSKQKIVRANALIATGTDCAPVK